MVEYGLLARGEDHRLAGEAAAIRKLLSAEWQLPDGSASGPAETQQTPSRQRHNDSGATTPASPSVPEKDQ